MQHMDEAFRAHLETHPGCSGYIDDHDDNVATVNRVRVWRDTDDRDAKPWWNVDGIDTTLGLYTETIFHAPTFRLAMDEVVPEFLTMLAGR